MAGSVPDIVQVALLWVQLSVRHMAPPLCHLLHAALAPPETIQMAYHRWGPVVDACRLVGHGSFTTPVICALMAGSIER